MTLSIALLSPADLVAIESVHEEFAAAMLRRDADARTCAARS